LSFNQYLINQCIYTYFGVAESLNQDMKQYKPQRKKRELVFLFIHVSIMQHPYF